MALDWHVISSRVVGTNRFGYPEYENKRSELGELLYKCKYRHSTDALEQLVEGIAPHIRKIFEVKIDLLIPVPHSDPERKLTHEVGSRLASKLGFSYSDSALKKSRTTAQVKNLEDSAARREILAQAFEADLQQMASRSILLLDDVYDSGATLSAATVIAKTKGNAAAIYVLALTRTR